MIQVDILPHNDKINDGDVFEINTKNVSYFSHSFFKYPAKFIPQIPNWAIKNFTEEEDYVLDCFMGSGTTLLESTLLNRIPLGVDFDKLSVLLTKVKCTPLSELQIAVVLNFCASLDYDERHDFDLPNFKNIGSWFSKETIKKLNYLYDKISNSNLDSASKDFLFICFVSIVRKTSFSDEQSPKPYVSKKHPKTPLDPADIFSKFSKIAKNYLFKFEDDYSIHEPPQFIGNDAKSFTCKKYLSKIDLVCCSPPYINAFDYVRVLSLENIWLRNLDDNSIISHKMKQIGTEQIYSKDYNKFPLEIGIKELDNVIQRIFELDKKRAHVVLLYFLQMKETIINIYKHLKKGGYFVLVVGNSVIRGVEVNASKYLGDLSKKEGFHHLKTFSYLIKTPYLRIPRKSNGGLIKYDRVIVLKKDDTKK
ncbi:MAG: DNA methyltransferase [Flavobacteriaceae bacterium]|nr:DNA methyltransferase [Flavobacteriaceae bacterium]